MDPNVCYLAMLEAFALGDLETARDRAESLGDWFFSRRVSASRQYRRRDRYPNRPLEVRHKGVTGRFFFSQAPRRLGQFFRSPIQEGHFP